MGSQQRPFNGFYRVLCRALQSSASPCHVPNPKTYAIYPYPTTCLCLVPDGGWGDLGMLATRAWACGGCRACRSWIQVDAAGQQDLQRLTFTMAEMKQIALDIGLASVASFSNFFAGSNEAALNHLELWSKTRLHSPVPTYIWGEPGSGKTHLLKAASEALHAQGARVGWMDASSLEPPRFDESWSAVVLDECHLYTAVQQQAAFSWLLNALSTTDGPARWVLCAGDLPPSDLPLREDLRSRLGWGHVFELHALSEPQRRSVLRAEADTRGVFLSDDAIDFMLRRFSRDLSSLMQLLDKLDSYALQTQRAITIPLIKAMLESE